MKRFVVLSVTAVLLCCAALFCACNKKEKPAPEPSLSSNVSFLQTHVLVGANENYAVELSIGKKERMFVADGKVDEVGNFTELNVTKLNGGLDGAYSFSITADGTTVEASLSKNVFGNTLCSTAELHHLADGITEITLISGEDSQIISLENKIPPTMNWEQALSIAEKEFSERISAEQTESGLQREIYLKFVRESGAPDAPYFWYVSFIGENNGFWALLLEPSTGTILAKK